MKNVGRSFFGLNSNIEISITQTGNNIVGELSGEYYDDFKGTIDGDTVTFKWHLIGKYYSDRWGKGEWKISADGNLLPGTWKTKYAGLSTSGSWNLTKIDQ